MKQQRGGGDRVSARLLVSGRVQGVGFRAFCLSCARPLHISGLVRNLLDGRVELEVEGERDRIEDLMLQLRQGPLRSEVLDLEVSWGEPGAAYEHFSIAD